MRPRPVTHLHPEHPAGENIVSVTPSKTTVVVVGVLGVIAGISLGWYLAGGTKIEQHYFATRFEAPKGPTLTEEDQVIMEVVS